MQMCERQRKRLQASAATHPAIWLHESPILILLLPPATGRSTVALPWQYDCLNFLFPLHFTSFHNTTLVQRISHSLHNLT
ncbi:Uncharacterized protein TCM_005992 [Theobroma cacao]|uniref:Uncharacterized protein n=1 Tax=Theobroma cacao TaxID=3641 RepID=A0A061DXN1_THECC|nr:Uncharacterized protein TCM_005992 [Theobroma cacao]